MANKIYKTYLHNPPHLFLPGVKYFITVSSFRHHSIFKDDEIKIKMLEISQKGCEKFSWILEDWVLLDNHYHLMLQSDPNNRTTIAKVINNFHKFLSLWLRKKDPSLKEQNKLFNNYWDTCIAYENSYYARLNYLWFNPVKHGYLEHPKDYPFGSYYNRYRNEKEYLKNLEKQYPFDKLDLE